METPATFALSPFEWLSVAGITAAVVVPAWWHILSRVQKLETKQAAHSEADTARFGEVREAMRELAEDHTESKRYWDTRFDGITTTLADLNGKTGEVLGYLKALKEK